MRAHLFGLSCLSFFLLASALSGAVISGTVKDASGGLVPNATVEISGGNLQQPFVLASDAQGRFTSADLPSGKYSIRVTSTGFEATQKSVDLSQTSLMIEV
ncbi:MAG TPA: carboxypeptidase-like regulatory domain-containing protein [Bryobacteraceae bacterium]|jgi:hypothetical protein|nr:carboxypeptidase-like regulatory domain-containing protein [Bryobacteraceae bacterium]